MTQKATKSNRAVHQDDSGTYYKDIVFVPSSNLSKNDSATAISSTTRKDVDEIREFYKSVLAMPKTEIQTGRRKKSSNVKHVSEPRLSGIIGSSSKDTASGISSPSSTPSSTTSSLSSPSNQSTVSSQQVKSSDSVMVPSPSATAILNIIQPSTMEKSNQPASDEIVRRNWSSNNHAGTMTATANTTLLPTQRIVAEGYVYCESCQMEIKKDDLDRHRRGTAHLMSQESSIKPIDTLTLGHENKGFRMLVKSGWDYEKGLGIEGQGARHPVATRLKHDRLAIGAAGTSKKFITHTFEEIEQSRSKPITKSNRRVPLTADDHRKKAEKERKDRVRMMLYMKK